MTSVSDWDGKPRGDTAYSEIERERTEEGERTVEWAETGLMTSEQLSENSYYTLQDLSCAFHIPGHFVDWKKETSLHFFNRCINSRYFFKDLKT